MSTWVVEVAPSTQLSHLVTRVGTGEHHKGDCSIQTNGAFQSPWRRHPSLLLESWALLCSKQSWRRPKSSSLPEYHWKQDVCFASTPAGPGQAKWEDVCKIETSSWGTLQAQKGALLFSPEESSISGSTSLNFDDYSVTATCDFGDSLDQALRDRFVCGLLSDSIRDACWQSLSSVSRERWK